MLLCDIRQIFAFGGFGNEVGMKNKDKASTTGTARVKFRVVEFEMDGGSDSLAEGLKAVANAITRANGSGLPASNRTLGGGKPAGANGHGSKSAGTEVEEDVELIEPEPEEEEDESPEDEESSTSSNGTKAKRAAPPRPNILNTLDVKSGQIPLKEFLDQRPPKKSQERLLVVAAWLFRQHQIENFNRDHIYTAYQQMGGGKDWRYPATFDDYVRTLTNRKGWFEKGTPEGHFKVTIVGLNHADDLANTQ